MTPSGLVAMNRLITSIAARKKLLLLIGLWLAAGTTAGYFLGASENRKGRSAVLVNNTNIRKDGAEVFLIYTCNNKEYARYDIDRAKLLATAQDELFGPSESLFQKTYTYAIAVLGGGGLAHAVTYVKPVALSLGMSKPQRMRYFIAGVISAASGLYVGYRMGSRQLPACDDPQIQQAVRQEAFWKPVAKLLATDLWRQASYLADLNEISPDQRPVLKAALVQIESGNANSRLFVTLLDEVKDRYTKLEQHPQQWAPVDFLMFAAVLVFIAGLLIYFFPAASEAPELPKKERKPR